MLISEKYFTFDNLEKISESRRDIIDFPQRHKTIFRLGDTARVREMKAASNSALAEAWRGKGRVLGGGSKAE